MIKMLRKLIFVLLFLPFLLPAKEKNDDLSIRCPVPDWVVPKSVPLDPLPQKPSQVNVQTLLIDSQRHLEEQTFYYHYAIKVLTQSGIESLSQIAIDFDPSYTRCLMHDIRVFRNGVWHDRFSTARQKLIQRETELDYHLYNGELTCVYFLDDIREGDIIEYAYSLVGQNPLASFFYTDCVYLQRYSSVERISHRLVANPELTFSTKLFNANAEPKIRDLTPDLREWIWEAAETPPFVEERSQPSWFNPVAHIQMSQYQSWQEVSRNILPLYNLPDDFPPSEISDLVETWRKSTSDLSELALLALRFVQDEIRYLGFEEGMGAFKPRNPRDTLNRRFGDCKDKAFLLHAFLKVIGIPSKMVLVHASLGKTLPDKLPSPFVFNHLVLQLDIGQTSYFVDPTCSLQGGTLRNNHFPNYEWGLVLAADTSDLIALPEPIVKNATEVISRYLVEEDDTAHLQMTSIFYDDQADRLRRSLNWNGPEKISDWCLSSKQEVYGSVSVRDTLEYSDDREGNIVTLVESYTLPTFTDEKERKLAIFSHTHKNYLTPTFNPQRASPFNIRYPLWIKERIEINSPFINWPAAHDTFTKSEGVFFYACSLSSEKNQTLVDFEYKHLQDHIPQEALHDSWRMLNEVYQINVPPIIVGSSYALTQNLGRHFILNLLALIIWFPISFSFEKRRPTQDELIFRLRKFQIFTTLLHIYCVLLYGYYTAIFATMPLTFTLSYLVYVIAAHRSVRLVKAIEAWHLILMLFVGLFFSVNMPNDGFITTLSGLVVFCFYMIPIMLTLEKVRLLLNKGKKSAVAMT